MIDRTERDTQDTEHHADSDGAGHQVDPGNTDRFGFGHETGAVSVMFAVLGFAIFAALALVVDGGRQLGALPDAQNLADNAARFGAQEVDVNLWRETGIPFIDPGRAETEIVAYLQPNIASGRIDPPVITVVEDTVTVEVTVNRRQFFFETRPATATETATALDGVTEATP